VLKLAASALSGALAVGGAGYSYVNRIESESAAVKAENVECKRVSDAQAARITGTELAISEAIRKLQAVQPNSGS
jgi:hypothetical protein